MSMDEVHSKRRNSDLTARIPLREHLDHAGKLLKMVHGMDRYYFLFCFTVNLLTVADRYLALVLSAYLLDACGRGETFWEIFRVAAAVCTAMFLAGSAAGWMDERAQVKQHLIYRRYHSLTEQRMLEMDFARINSPECEALKGRIQRDMNWGAGIFSVFYSLNRIVRGGLSLAGGMIVGFPAVKLMFSSGQYGVWLAVILAAAVSAVTTMSSNKHTRQLNQMLNSDFSNNEEFPLFLGLSFADGNLFHYQNGKDVRVCGGYDLVKQYALDNQKNPEIRQYYKKLGRHQGLAGLSNVISGRILEGGSYVVMAVLALGGYVTIGSVLKYAGCIRNVFGEIDALVKTVPVFFLNVRKHMSTMELLELHDEMYKGTLPVEKRSDGEYRIEFRNVSFRYPGSETYALRNFSLKLNVGEKLAIVGVNGSGKTTMIKLLCRIYDPEEGEILLNGVDIRKFRQEEYNRLFAVVFQDFKLFSFQLGENVAADSSYDREAVEKCLRDAGLAGRLEEMKAGVDTYLYKDYSDGVEFSGGEAQKAAIARAIYKDAPFILLDEPTAALDPVSEYEIYTGFDRIAGGRTAVYISHRLSSCRFCEKIAVFHEGRVVQMGSHEELLADKEGRYYELWSAQAGYYQ